MQCIQIIPMADKPNNPPYRPAFLKASGIARIPVPIFPLTKWINVSTFDVGWSTSLCMWGSYFIDEYEDPAVKKRREISCI